MNMPPVHRSKQRKIEESNGKNKNQRAERPNFETNPFFKKRSEARLAIERGRWMNSKRTQELAIALLTGYMQLLESDEGTYFIGYDELEIPDWQ